MSCIVFQFKFIPFMYNSRVPLLPMPPLPDQSAILSVDATAGNCSSRLSECSALLASSSGETHISANLIFVIFGDVGRLSDTSGRSC